HLRMTGSLRHATGRDGNRLEDDPYRRAVVRLDNGSDGAYRDVRRFGTWLLLQPAELAPHLAAQVGDEPLDTLFTASPLGQPPPRRAPPRPTSAGEGGAPRPANARGHGEHLRRRGAVAGAPPPASAGGEHRPQRAPAAPSRHPRRARGGDRPPGLEPPRLPPA